MCVVWKQHYYSKEKGPQNNQSKVTTKPSTLTETIKDDNNKKKSTLSFIFLSSCVVKSIKVFGVILISIYWLGCCFEVLSLSTAHHLSVSLSNRSTALLFENILCNGVTLSERNSNFSLKPQAFNICVGLKEWKYKIGEVHKKINKL